MTTQNLHELLWAIFPQSQQPRVQVQWGTYGVKLKDCLKRVNAAADILGIRALLVHAKDEQARAWYENFDFEPSPTDPLHLFLMLKDIRKMLE
ncbi:MAG: hypothetical protein ACFKPT_30690 [Gloeotrichia echinulata GP01]